jgi:hypothetical protein
MLAAEHARSPQPAARSRSPATRSPGCLLSTYAAFGDWLNQQIKAGDAGLAHTIPAAADHGAPGGGPLLFIASAR